MFNHIFNKLIKAMKYIFVVRDSKMLFEFFSYFSRKLKTLLVSQESINIRLFSCLTTHMDFKAILWSARQAKRLFHLYTYLFDKSYSPQGYFLICKTSWVVPIYTRRWFYVLRRGQKVGILELQKRELLGLKVESFLENHFKAPWG